MSSAVITSGGVPITSEGAPVEVGTPSYNEIAADLVARWNGDGNNDGIGDAINVANPGTYNGTLVGTTAYSDDVPFGSGKSFDFSGSDSDKFTHDLVTVVGDWSFSCWVKFIYTGWNLFFGKAVGNPRIGPRSGNGFNIAANTGEINIGGGNDFGNGEWNLCVVTYTAANDEVSVAKYRHDGTLQYINKGVINLENTIFDQVGAFRDQWGIPGLMYDPCHWSRALSLAEQLELAASTGPEPSNVSGTLASNGAFTCTADDPGNGTITYEWRVRNNATVISSGTGESGFATLQLGTNLFEVRASNLGGYGPGDKGDGWYGVASVLISSYWSLTEDPALVGRWNGDGDGDDIGDAINARNPGTWDCEWMGTAAYETPPYGEGKAFRFDGTNHLRNTTFPMNDYRSAATVCGWMKQDASPTISTMLSGMSSTHEMSAINSAIKWWNVSPTNGVADFPTPAAGQWFHVIGTAAEDAQGGTMTRVLWVDGEYKDTGATSVPLTMGTYLTIGARQIGSGMFRDPSVMYDIMLFGRVLNDAEKLEIYNKPEPKPLTGATLTASGSYSLGSWDSFDNGTMTYEARIIQDGEILDTEVGATGTFGSLPVGEYTLEGRVTNDGGYGSGDSSYGGWSDGWYELTTLLVVDEHVNTEYAVKVFPITAASKHPGVTASHKVILQTTAIHPPLG